MKNNPTNLLIAFQGERGAFGEEAALKYFTYNNIKTVPYETFKDVMCAVDDGKANYGVLPVENSREGNIDEACDLLLDFDLCVVAEIKLRVVHCLIVHVGAEIRDIKKVYSHPQGFRQCRDFLNRYAWERIPTYNTAGSVMMISDRNDKREAAIASKRAAAIYQMKILKEGIENDIHNYTRFFAISLPDLGMQSLISSKEKKAMKTSIVFATHHVPGALYDCLGELARRDINMTKLESRPSRDKNWEYVFFVDFEGSLEEEKCRSAIDGIKKKASFLKILGSYPSAEDF